MRKTYTLEDYPFYELLDEDDKDYLHSVLWEVYFDKKEDLILEVYNLLLK